jgi:UTP--glucose-1-phosphate uridylyltransferase
LSRVRKAVIPAAGLGTRFLPFSKAVPKEMLPIVDRPVIQYVIEEAVDAGIDDILVITSRYKKVLEDHFDRLLDLEAALEAKGKPEEAAELRSLAELAQLHYVRQGEARGLGHAIGTARNHVGNEPFVVLLGDDVMHPSAGVLKGMLDTYDQHGCSVVALMEVPKDEISSYGCAAVERPQPPSPSGQPSSGQPSSGQPSSGQPSSGQLADRVVRITELVEKPAPEVAPSNLAVMGRYLFTPAIFDHIDATPPGVGGEIQITDAMVSLMEHEPLLGYTFSQGRFDTGKKIDYLRAVVELALERDDVGPAFREILAEVAVREGLVN